MLCTGNLTGDFSLLADLGSKSLTASLGDDAPWILVSNHGRGIMLLLVLGVIFPLRSSLINLPLVPWVLPSQNDTLMRMCSMP